MPAESEIFTRRNLPMRFGFDRTTEIYHVPRNGLPHPPAGGFDRTSACQPRHVSSLQRPSSTGHPHPKTLPRPEEETGRKPVNYSISFAISMLIFRDTQRLSKQPNVVLNNH